MSNEILFCDQMVYYAPTTIPALTPVNMVLGDWWEKSSFIEQLIPHPLTFVTQMMEMMVMKWTMR